MQELIKQVRQHALENYTAGGWDYIVEAWEDKDIEEAIQGATTLDEAVVLLQPTMNALAERDRGAY